MRRTSLRAAAFVAAAAILALLTALLPPGPAGAARKPPPPCAGERHVRPDGSLYACTFFDEFNGTSLDLTKWIVQATAWSGFGGGPLGHCYVDEPFSVQVGSGELRLTSRKEKDLFVCSSPYGSYLTDLKAASIGTRGRFAQAFGRFAFRARFPNHGTRGLHSALWLYPAKKVYGEWPASGEIDVAEWFSARPELVYPSVHYVSNDDTTPEERVCTVPTARTQFHRYEVEWLTEVIRFYYDGKLCWSHTIDPTTLTAPQPFDQPFDVVLTQTMGLAWNSPDASTPPEGTLEVDWVRVWK